MNVGKLKHFLKSVPDDFIVLIEAYNNSISEFHESKKDVLNNNIEYIKSEVTTLDVWHDIRRQDCVGTDENGEIQIIPRINRLGGTFTLSNIYEE